MKWIKRLFKFGIVLALAATLSGVGAILAAYFYLEPNLPSIEHLKDVRLQVPLRVFSEDKKLIAEFGEKRRIPLAYKDIPEQLIQAVLAAEDDRFFEHPGVDYQGILRAATQLVLTGERRQGGSTITMQVARNFFLSREKTFVRKLNEIFLALRIEQQLSKREILELYLNKIYLGHRAYGVGAAADVYYGQPLSQLSLPQIAMIAGLPKAPSRFNPIADPDRALMRRDYVLGRMQRLGFISAEQYNLAMATPVTATLHGAATKLEAPYVAEMVRAKMVARYGNDAYTGGYSVYTTIKSRDQEAANRAVRLALDEYDRRHGYRGPEQQLKLPESLEDALLDELLSDQKTVGNLRPGLVVSLQEQSADVYLGNGEHIRIGWDGLSWARSHKSEDRQGKNPATAADVLDPGDIIRVLKSVDKGDAISWRLAQIPAAEGALISLNPQNGAILALVGGYDFYKSKFNRAAQAKRQPGSGFKAFVYSAALEAGFSAASMINDAPVVFEDPALEDAWRPENYSGKFFGPTRLRQALVNSRNLVSIRLLRSMGIEHGVQHIARFGFDPNELPHNLSLALGSGAVTLTQMAEGYAVLANGGYRVESYFFERIELDHEGIVYKAKPLLVCPECELAANASQQPAGLKTVSASVPKDQLRRAPRVISEQNVFLMNSLMRDVIRFGTGKKARSLGRSDLAGKTGTTNDQRDAWFSGFNQSLVAVTWVGFDSSDPLGRGETGGRAALPAWIHYMRTALDGIADSPPKMPNGLITVRIDPETGERSSANRKDAIFEVFRIENVPKSQPRVPRDSAGKAAATTHSAHSDFNDPF